MRPITKAVIAVAGFGTRFLPATKSKPKEMLPIIDKPIIHYLVEEAKEARARSGRLFDSRREHLNEKVFSDLLAHFGKTI